MPRSILVIDTPSVKRYVFGTDALAEIRGASALLDTLNRQRTPEKIEEIPGARKIYANGGSAQFMIEAERDVIERQARALQRLYREETASGATIAYGIGDYPNHVPYPEALRQAFDDLRAQRERLLRIPPPDTFPLVKECESCSFHPVEKRVRLPEGKVAWLCAICARKRRAKREVSEKGGVWKEFEDHAGRRIERIESLQELGEWIAIVYADGNSMGKWVKSLPSPESFSIFSKTVDAAIRTACFETLLEIFGTKRVKADILLLGGDDLIVAIEANHALDFAYEVAKRFSEATRIDPRVSAPTREAAFIREGIGERGFTISVGVAVGKVHHPFRLLLQTAEELLKSAKQRGSVLAREEEATQKRRTSPSKGGRRPALLPAPACIDFHRMTVSNTVDLTDIRQETYEYAWQGDHYRRTRRPHTLEELDRFLSAVRFLKGVNFPKGRLRTAYEALFAPTPSHACLEMIELFVRGRRDTRKTWREFLERIDAFDTMPWSDENDSMLSEVVEFYDLIAEGQSNGSRNDGRDDLPETLSSRNG